MTPAKKSNAIPSILVVQHWLGEAKCKVTGIGADRLHCFLCALSVALHTIHVVWHCAASLDMRTYVFALPAHFLSKRARDGEWRRRIAFGECQ